MTFRVGQKVVCVRDDWVNRGKYGLLVPDKGNVYTIRGFQYHGEFIGLFFFEIKNEIGNWEGCIVEPSFGIRYFRPVDEKKTDISFAHEILRKATKKEKA